MKYDDMTACGPIRPYQKKKAANIYGVCIVDGKMCLTNVF
jgi:hypothetical protein